MEYASSVECCTRFSKIKLKCRTCVCCHSLEEWLNRIHFIILILDNLKIHLHGKYLRPITRILSLINLITLHQGTPCRGQYGIQQSGNFVVHFVREEQLDTSVEGVNLKVLAKVEGLPV